VPINFHRPSNNQPNQINQFNEPIYQPFPPQRNPSSNQQVYEAMGLRRDLSFPMLPTNEAQTGQRKFLPSSKVVAVERRPPQPMMQRPLSTYDGIYEVPAKLSLMNDPIRTNRPIVTYVRPQPAQKQNLENVAKDSKNILKNEMKSNHVQDESSRKRNDSKSSSVNSRITTSRPSSSNATKEAIKKSDKKSAFSLQSFFGKAKAKPPKGKGQEKGPPGSAHVPVNPATGQISGIIRPPHSHRFSPPAQWTQV
jgi:hypothetical protein